MLNEVSRIALPAADGSVLTHPMPGACFETADFVAGPENHLLVPAIEQLLAQSEGSHDGGDAALFNPLVLVGATGLGKSHIARGITRQWTRDGGDPSAEYLTANDFARQVRDARDEGSLPHLRERWGSLRLFVLEDLQNLPSSVFVQRELRCTLDALQGTGATIVVTANKTVASISGLNDGLRDRLAAGLTIRLQSPDVESRQELLRAAAARRGLSLDGEQLRHLAETVEGTVPQLNRALAEWELAERHQVGQATDDCLERSPQQLRESLEFKQILAVVARYFSLTQAALRGPARRKSLVYARSVAIHLARTLTNLSYSQIGLQLGRRDHTTIMHSSQIRRDRLASDTTTQQDVEELRRILTAV